LTSRKTDSVADVEAGIEGFDDTDCDVEFAGYGDEGVFGPNHVCGHCECALICILELKS
jgi:hypothetical protein